MAAKPTKDDQGKMQQQFPVPIYLVDADGNKTHVVFSIDDARVIFDDYLRRELQRGFDQADRGESQLWDTDATLAEAHERHANRSSKRS